MVGFGKMGGLWGGRMVEEVGGGEGGRGKGEGRMEGGSSGLYVSLCVGKKKKQGGKERRRGEEKEKDADLP